MTRIASFALEMQALGWDIESPWDLVNQSVPYPDLIPVLLDWLHRATVEVPEAERERFREGVVRALNVKQARGMGAALASEFWRRGASWGYLWAVGNTLAGIADRTNLDDLVRIARERSFGSARERVVEKLGHFRDEAATRAIIDSLDDHSVVAAALRAAARLRLTEAVPAARRRLEDSSPAVREAARRVLARTGAAA